MAKSDDTSKPTRSRRNQRKALAAPPSATRSAINRPPTPLLTLEEVIENERTLLLQIRAMLHCLYEVLLYADDDDSVMHAEVAQTSARLINESCARLDAVKLQPLIEAIRKGGGDTPRADESDVPGHGPYQVREPTPVYLS